MKKAIMALGALMVSLATYAQGELTFNNRVGTDPLAPIFNQDGVTGFGATAGSKAALFLVSGTGASATLSLIPNSVTTFRGTSGALAQFINGITVTVPGIASGANATVRVRAYNGADYATSSLRGESNDVTVTLGGGLLTPPNLSGLQSFSVVPEPSTIALAALGAIGLLFRRRK